MRIAYITSHINRSNQWNWFSDILISKEVFHVHIIINSYKPIMYTDMKEKGLDVYFLEHKNIFSFAINFIKVIRILKRQNINIVHTELPYGNLIGQLAAYLCGVKQRILTCENLTWGEDYHNRKQKFIDWLSFRITRKVVALTSLSKRYIIEKFGKEENQVVVIYHSLNTQDYLNVSVDRVEGLRSNLEIPADRFVIGVISRFEFWKGIEYAVKAMQNVVEKYPDSLLVIFGGSQGDSFEDIQALIKKLKLENNVKHVGYVSDNIALYSLLDIQLHVPIDSYVETFGITIIEGMISGCPQILTLSGIANDIAQDQKNCIVVNHCSSIQIAEALLLLRENPELREKIARQAKLDAAKYFNYTDKVNRHLKLYSENI